MRLLAFGDLLMAAICCGTLITSAGLKAAATDDVPSTESSTEQVRALVGAPQDGLPCRVLVGETATKDDPHRLVVWLHPSGGSMNNVVERMAPILIEQDLALVTFTKKDFRGWSQSDAQKMSATLDALGKIAGISSEKPILLGYSAGGQLALMLWNQQPQRWGGLILDAAYPVTFDPQTRKAKLPDLPDDAKAIKHTPFFVLVGGRDGGARLWQQAEEKWRDAGVPLQLEYVPDQGHKWLFGAGQSQRLSAWFNEIASGEKPSKTIGAPAPPRGMLGVVLDGTRIAQVQADSPAAKAGLQPDDVIQQIDNIKVVNRQAIVRRLGGKSPGDKVQLVISRDGEILSTEATLAAP